VETSESGQRFFVEASNRLVEVGVVAFDALHAFERHLGDARARVDAQSLGE
jgi:hypothetical protein